MDSDDPCVTSEVKTETDIAVEPISSRQRKVAKVREGRVFESCAHVAWVLGFMASFFLFLFFFLGGHQ